MTDQEKASATCGECGRGYRVPDATRTYKCKACGGSVRAVTASPEPALDGPTCEACGAMHASGVQFCEECGEALGSTSAPRRRSHAERKERGSAARDLARGRKTISVVRWIYGILIFLELAWLSYLIQGRAIAGEELRSALDLLIGLTAAYVALMVAGWIFIARQPFMWAVILASVQTLLAVLGTLGGDTNLLSYGLAVVLWALVPATVKIRRLLAEYPDLYASRHMTHRGSTSPDDRKRHLLTAAIAVGIVLGTWGVYAFVNRTPSFAPVEERFVEAWNDGGASAVARLYAADAHEEKAALIEGLAADESWSELPDITSPGALEDLENGDKQLTFDVDGRSIATVWTLGASGWVLDGLQPPFGAQAVALQASWNRSDIGAVAACYRTPEKLERSLRNLAEKRGWGESLPELGEPQLLEASGSTVRIAYPIATGSADVLEVRFALDDVRWRARSLKPPKSR